MSGIGSDIAAAVSGAILDTGLGASVTLTTVTAGVYNPATGAATPSTSTRTITAIVEEYDGAELMAGLGAAGDKKVSVPAAQLTTAPKPSDKATVGGVTYAVISVRTEEAGGVAILYVLQCRKA